MDKKLAWQTTSLSETLLIPLWARAVEYGRKDVLLDDPDAKRMMDAIDYDFSKFSKATMSQVGCCARAQVFDAMTKRFIVNHPDALIVHLGAGLDARYERLGRPTVSAWYDLDLPEVMAIRRQLLPEQGNHYIEQSLFDSAWMQKMAILDKPVLLVIEGVLMYFSLAEVQAWFLQVAEHLPSAHILFDMVPPVVVGKAKHHDSLKTMGKTAPNFLWSLKDSREIESWPPGWQVHETAYLSDYAVKRFPWIWRLFYRTHWGYHHLNQRIVWVSAREARN